MSNRLLSPLLALIAVLFLYGCRYSGSHEKKEIEGDFAHVVLMWFQNPEDEKLKKQFEKDCLEFCNASKYIDSFHLGTPANTNRPIIDTSYTYCLIVTFESEQEQEMYQQEKVHLDFVEKYKKHWDRILIYDSVMQ